MVQSDGRQLKLWAHAIEHLASAHGAARRCAALQKFYVEPDLSHTEPLPLGAVYVLREARPPHLRHRATQRGGSGAAVAAHAYRPLLVRRMGQRADYFHAAAAIANRAGIFRLTRPLDFKAMPDVIAALERHWAEIRLTGAAA